jgi:hypothetical protein
MILDDKYLDYLAGLVSADSVNILDLPYTTTFDKILTAFNEYTGLECAHHELWELLLVVNSREPKTVVDAHSSAIAPPAALEKGEYAAAIHAGNDDTFPTTLFDSGSPDPRQPWLISQRPTIHTGSSEAAKRQKVLANVANSELGTIELRVAHILDRFPETRNSDVSLCIRYWKYHQARELSEWGDPKLGVLYDLDKLSTIIRSRQTLQNKLNLYWPSEDIMRARRGLQCGFNELFVARKSTAPEIRFYLDETGNEGDKRFTGVAGLCIMNWQQYEIQHAALSQWRRALKWPGTFHFSDTGRDGLARAVDLLGQLQARRDGLLFVGYSVPTQGHTNKAMLSLFVNLIIDSLKNMRQNGCLNKKMDLRIVKEAEMGFDKIYIKQMAVELSDMLTHEFEDDVVLVAIDPLPKGVDVFLECADLIAGGMQRRVHYKSSGTRDRLAEAVVNVTGFENPQDGGVVYKCYPF